MNPLTYIIINIAVIVLIQTGALRVEMGILTQGAVVALYNYMSQILTELVKIANLIINITKAVACANRIQSVLDIEPDMPVNPDMPVGNTRYRVEFDAAGLQYPGAAELSLENIEKLADLYGYDGYMFYEENENIIESMLTTAFRVNDLSSEDMEQIAAFKRIVKNSLMMDQMLLR